MSSYRCAHCRETKLPELQILAETVAGVHWWACTNVPMVQADAVHRLVRDGRCARHAALIGALLAHAIAHEASMRTVPPGEVQVRRVIILDPPFEVVSGKRFRQALAELRKFVRGTELAALIEHDREARRIRIALTLVSDAGSPSVIMPLAQIRATTSRALIATMRRVELERVRRAG